MTDSGREGALGTFGRSAKVRFWAGKVTNGGAERVFWECLKARDSFGVKKENKNDRPANLLRKMSRKQFPLRS